MNQTKLPARFGEGACRAILAAILIALMPAAILPAAAQDDEKPRWFGSAYDDVATLVYGVPDSDYVILSFSCRRGASVVKLDLQDEQADAEEGDLVRASLATNGIHVEFSDKATMNQDSGGIELHADLPLDEALRRVLTSGDEVTVTVGGQTQRYAMEAAAEPAAAMFAVCDSPRPPNDLDVTVTNRASLPVESLGYSETGVDAFDSDAFGYEPLEPGASRTFTIPGGRDICTFDMAVLFAEEAEEDGECCRVQQPTGTQDLCENGEFVVHD